YQLWKGGEIEIPIPAVPGLNFMVDPSVSVVVAGGVDFKDKKVKASVGVNGGVGIGFSYGNSKVASFYGTMESNVHGGFQYERTKGSTSCMNKWELSGGFALSTNFAVGVKLGGGVLDAKFAFGQCDIGRLTGLHWEDGRFDKNKIGWAWGAQPQAFFHKIKTAIEKAKYILGLPKKAAKKAWKAAGATVRGLGGIVRKLDLTPWDGLLPFV
ncbi:MAG: hypothetical protein H0T79_13790, partial [Deltaproteobacteria bacterium]|nr:hypothetical protein [Deltaproteobacteria bacterium]